MGAFTVDKDREARREVGKKERAAYSYTHSKNIYSDYIIGVLHDKERHGDTNISIKLSFVHY